MHKTSIRYPDLKAWSYISHHANQIQFIMLSFSFFFFKIGLFHRGKTIWSMFPSLEMRLVTRTWTLRMKKDGGPVFIKQCFCFYPINSTFIYVHQTKSEIEEQYFISLSLLKILLHQLSYSHLICVSATAHIGRPQMAKWSKCDLNQQYQPLLMRQNSSTNQFLFFFFFFFLV